MDESSSSDAFGNWIDPTEWAPDAPAPYVDPDPQLPTAGRFAEGFFDLDQDHVGYWHDAGEGEWAGRHDDGIDQLGASKLMADMLVQKYYGGKYWATDICKL